MRSSGRYALSIGAVAALLAGCGALPLSLSKGQDELPAPIGEMRQTSSSVPSRDVPTAWTYKQLHRFGRLHRPYQIGGTQPQAALIDVNGTLYGTTAYGAYPCPHPGYKNGESGCGTVFSISPSGVRTVLHVFRGGASDGEHPSASLIDVNGTLYGTTQAGGGTGCLFRVGCGTVYSITTSGVETVLHKFAGGSDGAVPWSELTNLNGTLYGTTSEGGGYCVLIGSASGCGTVYSISTSGGEKVLFAFGTPSSKACCIPISGLVALNGMLYGTTVHGGQRCFHTSNTGGCGSVFSITTRGAVKTLYKFEGGADGGFPVSTLVNVNGTLYGTTFGQPPGLGTVYSITTGGVEKVLHSFHGTPDGQSPHGGLIDVNGTLFGTTENGGSGCGSGGCGTIYSITTSRKETVLYSFTGTPDGGDPKGALLDVNGTLYGTTMHGGNPKCASVGCGTLFSLSPTR